MKELTRQQQAVYDFVKSYIEKMTDNEFRLLLEAAVCGDREALDSLLALYMPLINRLSSYAGNLDEDCRQYIMLHIVLHISEFRI